MEDSVRCTRSVSVASLGSELPNTSVGWQSCLDTASNSNRMSPVSPSELPDSPTQCAKMVVPKGDTSTPLSISIRGGSGAASSSEPRSGLTASDTTTAVVDDQPTPTFAAFAMLNQQAPPVAPSSPKHGGHSPSSSVFDVYASVDCVDGDDLLTRSIEAVLPQPAPSSATPKQQRRVVDDRLLADMIESAQPSARKPCHGCAVAHISPNASFLLIAMTTAIPLLVTPQKDKESSKGEIKLAERIASILKDFEARQLNWSDDGAGSMEHPDITLPLDCFVDEDITIDCSAMSLPHEQPSSNSRSVVKSPKSTPPCNGARLRSGTPQRTKLPKPTTRMSLQKSTRSDAKLTPKKEAKSAVVPPYNYRKPEVREIEKQTGKAVNPGQMLVTTV
ncbi:unnamed protein product [Heligmosomoides polygyrus]|uniref:Uncharacterized protein n=1 Tax=Heligmosomoides polygyrus TaxID=6339 RepID=A0A3P8G9S8_HELPZ|nr:unnamed protein product [Heligmosomoides polygyrus]